MTELEIKDAALRRALCALNILLADFAEDQFDIEHVKGCRAEIQKNGTLSFFAENAESIRRALENPAVEYLPNL